MESWEFLTLMDGLEEEFRASETLITNGDNLTIR